jgi:ubiquinone/menaquinone biosynthesis C-methylase UbiE
MSSRLVSGSVLPIDWVVKILDRDDEQTSMSGGFGSGFVRLDDEAEPDAWLEHLDDAAAVPMVRDAKLRLTEALALRPGERVLDLGAGTGVDSVTMARAVSPGGRVVAADVSEAAVAAATRRLATVEGAEAVVADAHALPFPAASFDACRIDRTLLHLADPEQALGELHRVLAPAGRLGIQEFGRRLEGDANVLAGPVHEAVTTGYWGSGSKVAELPLFLPIMLARAGFDDVRIERLASRSTDFQAADTLMRLRAGAEEARVAPEDAAAWLQHLREAMAAGAVSLVWQGMLFTARTPPISPPSGH